MTKTIFEEMGGTYRQVGDYLLPNITVQTKETECIGLWGQRHARHLKEYHMSAKQSARLTVRET